MGQSCQSPYGCFPESDGTVRVAVVHDWLVTNAGAEKVLKEIIDLYPDAEIFSLVDFLTDKERNIILQGKKVHTSFLQKLPFARAYFRHYLPLFPRAIEGLDLSGYDLIISSSWAVAKGVKKEQNALHICYCHTPIRYAWDLYDEYTSDLKQPKKYIVQKTLQFIRKWDIDTLGRVDLFIANSNYVRERIKRIYAKEAEVVYPPVDVDRFVLCREKEDFYLTASRLVPYKKTRLIVEAFNRMPDKKLVVIGAGEEYEALRQIAKPHISVMGYQEDAVLTAYMQKAKAFVYAAVEDFGIVPVEAMACGTPVIALNDGGTKETVIDGVTGIHFTEQTAESIAEALCRFEQTRFNPDRIRAEAMRYTSFKARFSRLVNELLPKF